jgi:hypothetical protein
MPDRYRLWFAAGSNEFATDGTRFDIRRRTRGGCERKQAKRSAWTRQSIVEHIATFPFFNAEQELTLYDFGS